MSFSASSPKSISNTRLNFIEIDGKKFVSIENDRHANTGIYPVSGNPYHSEPFESNFFSDVLSVNTGKDSDILDFISQYGQLGLAGYKQSAFPKTWKYSPDFCNLDDKRESLNLNVAFFNLLQTTFHATRAMKSGDILPLVKGAIFTSEFIYQTNDKPVALNLPSPVTTIEKVWKSDYLTGEVKLDPAFEHGILNLNETDLSSMKNEASNLILNRVTDELSKIKTKFVYENGYIEPHPWSENLYSYLWYLLSRAMCDKREYRQCAREKCQHWFVDNDKRKIFCTPKCAKVEANRVSMKRVRDKAKAERERIDV